LPRIVPGEYIPAKYFARTESNLAEPMLKMSMEAHE
jgi:hypothetical protein